MYYSIDQSSCCMCNISIILILNLVVYITRVFCFIISHMEFSSLNFPLPFTIRRMNEEDYSHGVLECLSQLTELGTITRDAFIQQLAYWNSLHDTYYPYVITIPTPQHSNTIIVGTGMLLIERKLIHNCGKVGHIEDIVINNTYRGNNLGKILVGFLTDLARDNQCYKVILDCDTNNEEFYHKCGYQVKGTQMAKYFPK